ncbi:vacuolar protein sorting-associated protein 37A-like [Paramacrobiotus metropolitanus]|uniref:vacuolar protein sorting-associated protein 37A-like n=1 Tax=Paramacrobiotus metropolitanus TaxID=2943436 RepID=UPI002445AE54|nr:vacuolar protein sorting-associated protein 37A-like [Paramacrobiotus metropolitanus]
MSLFSNFWSKKPEEAQVSPHQAQRQKQIDALRQQHRNILEVTRDSSYRVPFSVGTQTFFIDINLTVMFPREPPMLRLNPRGTHPWVDPSGIIKWPKLTSFNMHSDLGRLIEELVEEFQRNPPSMPRDIPPSESMPSLYPNASMNSFPSFVLPPVPRRSDSPSVFPTNNMHSTFRHQESMFNSVGDNFPELKNMSNAELQAILDTRDEQILLNKIAKTPVIASLRDEFDRLSESNRRLAEENLTRKTDMEKIKSDLFEKYSLGGEMRQQFDDLQRKQEGVMRQYEPSMIQDQLRIAAASAENESEETAEDFLAGKLDLDSFLPKFLEKRKIMHSRRALEDALSRQSQIGAFF